LTEESGIPTLWRVFSRISQAEKISTISAGFTATPYPKTSALHSFAGHGSSTRGRGLPPRGCGGSRSRGPSHGV